MTTTQASATLTNAATGATEARRRLLDGLSVTERRYEYDGFSTAVLEAGEGTPVVLLHGPGEYAAKWLRVLPELAAGFRVIAPDLPGHGASHAPEGELSPRQILAWLDDLVERTCPAPPVLVGHIVGGAIAARYAAVHADRLRTLVLADSLGLAPFAPRPDFGGALMEFASDPREETHDRLWELCAFDLDRLRAALGRRWDAIRAYNLQTAGDPTLGRTRQRLMDLFGFPPVPDEELERISVPTTLVWGRHDLATPLGVAIGASQRFGWPLHVIEDAADDPALEQPEEFVRALRAAISPAVPGRA